MSRQIRTFLFYWAFLIVILLNAQGVFANSEETEGTIILDLDGYIAQVALTDTLGHNIDIVREENGEYRASIPVGYYRIYAGSLGMEPTLNQWLYVPAGDTVRLYHQFEPYTFPEDTWSIFNLEEFDLMKVQLSDSDNQCLDGLTIFARYAFFRENRISSDEYEIFVDNTCFEVFWNLPFLGDMTVDLPYRTLITGDNPTLYLHIEKYPETDSILAANSTIEPLVIAGITDDEWVSPDFSMQRTLINPADWGHEELYKYGYVDGRAYFDETENGESWRIVLAFHRRVVVLTENSEPIQYDLEGAISRVVFSPRGRYLFFFDASQGLHRREDAILLNSNTGEARYFIPDPYAEPYEWKPSFSSHISTTPYWTYHPADDGTVIALFVDSLKYFNEDLELTDIQYFEGVRFGDGYNFGLRSRSSEGDRVFVIDCSDENIRLLRLNADGSIKYNEPINGRYFCTDTALTILTGVDADGISLWGLETGALLLHIDSGYSGYPSISPGGSLIGLSPGYITSEIRSADSGELIDSFVSGTGPGNHFRIYNLGDDGSCVLQGNVRGDRYRFALRSGSGELIWVSASRFAYSPRTNVASNSLSSIRDLRALSSDGKTLVYNDGCYIQILRFEREPLNSRPDIFTDLFFWIYSLLGSVMT